MYTLNMKYFIHWGGGYSYGLTLEFLRDLGSNCRECPHLLCACVCPSYFTSVKFSFVTYKMSEIILFLERLYKN